MNNGPVEIEVFSTNDFEFGINKKRKCKYKIFNPHHTKGLVVYIPGFGVDLGEYTEVFCKKISEKFSLATMSVEYFCIHCRPSIGAEIEFELEDINQFSGILAQEQGKDTIEKIVTYTEKNNIRINANASLKPKKGEYQNFGILAAIDTINCIKDATDKFSFNKNNIILIGSSYGGYIANIATKIYPGLIRAVFDNSSWAQPNLAYVVGRELNKPEFILKISEKLSLNLFVKSPWTLKANLPNSFSGDKYLIRSFDYGQVKQMFNNGGGDTFYIF